MDKDPVLSAGEYTFDFECKLPQELPSSFEGRHGHVRYLARACIERNWKSNVVTKKAFTILNGLDLNFIPEAAVSTSPHPVDGLGRLLVRGCLVLSDDRLFLACTRHGRVVVHACEYTHTHPNTCTRTHTLINKTWSGKV